MSVKITLVDTKAQLKQYIFLCEKIYKTVDRWVPPFYEDEWAFHNPKKNKALQHCDVIRVLAKKDGNPVGRIMGIIHTAYNQLHQEKTARFFNLDCVNDQQVAHALIEFIEQWALKKGMNKLIGPFGFSDKDPQGLQIEGFDFLPVLATAANPTYLPELVMNEGYGKEVDCVSYQMKIPKKIPELYERIHQRISRNQNLKLVEFRSKLAIKPYIIPVLQLVNETYAPLFGFAPMSEEEMRKFANQYLPVLDPDFVKVVIDKENHVVAFVVAIPDMSIGIQKAKGRIFPFGFFYILNAMKKSKQLNLMLGAIKNNYRGSGVSAFMGKAMLKICMRRGIEVMDSHLILEDNFPMRGECEKLEGKVCKRYRIFSKQLG
jgi:hypothetical protein